MLKYTYHSTYILLNSFEYFIIIRCSSSNVIVLYIFVIDIEIKAVSPLSIILAIIIPSFQITIIFVHLLFSVIKSRHHQQEIFKLWSHFRIFVPTISHYLVSLLPTVKKN